jgi:hypothetical protein
LTALLLLTPLASDRTHDGDHGDGDDCDERRHEEDEATRELMSLIQTPREPDRRCHEQYWLGDSHPEKPLIEAAG